VHSQHHEIAALLLCLQDIARLTLAALRNDACNRRTLTLAGPNAYTTKEVIEKCENLSDSRAQVSTVPTWLLKGTRGLLKGADWAKDAADRLVSSERQGFFLLSAAHVLCRLGFR
jgi:uncharacterized protein YbjT (DUF2867 family)